MFSKYRISLLICQGSTVGQAGTPVQLPVSMQTSEYPAGGVRFGHNIEPGGQSNSGGPGSPVSPLSPVVPGSNAGHVAGSLVGPFGPSTPGDWVTGAYCAALITVAADAVKLAVVAIFVLFT